MKMEMRYIHTVFAAPIRSTHTVMLEAGSLNSINDSTPHPELSDDLVQRSTTHKELFRRVRCAKLIQHNFGDRMCAMTTH